MAPSTPPPPSRVLLAAFTIASTFRVVISASRMVTSGMGIWPPEFVPRSYVKSPIRLCPADPVGEKAIIKTSAAGASPSPLAVPQPPALMSLRQQPAAPSLSEAKYRELMNRMRANRPNDDLNLVRKAYEYSLQHHEGQIGRASCRER